MIVNHDITGIMITYDIIYDINAGFSLVCTGFAPFSQPHHKLTPGPKRLTVHSCQRRKHTTILPVKMVNNVKMNTNFNNCNTICH